jgi:DNA-binding LytR/AlgR family response regulator
MRNGLALSNQYSELEEKNHRKPQSLHAQTLAFRPASAMPAVNFPSPENESFAGWKSKRLAIKANGKIVLIDPAEILAVEAQGNYVLLRQKSGSLMVREQISVLADKLHPYGLIRIHRSVLVNAVHVEDVESLSTGEHLLRMKEGREYHVTRTYKGNLQLLSPTWIGA